MVEYIPHIPNGPRARPGSSGTRSHGPADFQFSAQACNVNGRMIINADHHRDDAWQRLRLAQSMSSHGPLAPSIAFKFQWMLPTAVKTRYPTEYDCTGRGSRVDDGGVSV
jgi:hypothetical protein